MKLPLLPEMSLRYHSFFEWEIMGKKSKQFKTSLVMQKEGYSTKTDLASQCKFNEVELYILILSDVLSGLRIPCCRLFPMGNFARLR